MFFVIYGRSVVPGLQRERACQARCRDPAASALTINRGDGVDSGRRRTVSFACVNRCQRQVKLHLYGRPQIPRNLSVRGGRRHFQAEDDAYITDGIPSRC